MQEKWTLTIKLVMVDTIHQNMKRMEVIHLVEVVELSKIHHLKEEDTGKGSKTRLLEVGLEIEEGHLQCKVNQNNFNKIIIEIRNQVIKF